MRAAVTLLLLLIAAPTVSEEVEKTAPSWERRLEPALNRAAVGGRPILVYLFDSL